MNDIEKTLLQCIETKNVPNILLYGPKHSGKKTILMNFMHTLYKKNIDDYVLILDCIVGTGIHCIRNDLTFFLKKVILKKDNIYFKSVILLNIDYLTIDAQSALRRLIEIYSYNTRFFVVINEKNRIIFPILSRFCSFYVNGNTKQNLKHSKCIIPKKFLQSKQTFLNTQMKNFETKYIQHNKKYCFELVEKLYYKGYNCKNIMNYIENNSIFQEKSNFKSIRIELTHFFETNRYNNRDEKLIMVFVLHKYIQLLHTYINT